jgi:hypothetical protein
LGVANGHNFLYVTNFHTGRVKTYDENFFTAGIADEAHGLFGLITED